jgi:hypothetical protein
MLQNRVRTADRLLLRQWPNEYFCLLCIRNLETVTHLLMECPFTRSVWHKSANGSHCRACIRNIGRKTAWWFGDLSGALPRMKSKGAKSLVILACWTVLCERNRRIFDKVERDAGQLVAVIQSQTRQWIKAGARRLVEVVAQQLS